MPRRIDDHSFWAGKSSRDSVLPEETRVKGIEDVEGAGEIDKYEDTEEMIRAQQEKSVKKAEDRPLKENYRN